METEKDRQEVEHIAMALYEAVPDGVKIYNYIDALMVLIVNESYKAIKAGTPQNFIEEATMERLKSLFESIRKENNKLN